MVLAGHLCHIQPIDEEKKCKGIIFYDMETTQEDEVADGVNRHQVNLVCAKKVGTVHSLTHSHILYKHSHSHALFAAVR